MKILLLNAGSSSLKATLADAASGATRSSATVDWSSSPTQYQLQPEGEEKTRQNADWKGFAQAVRQVIEDLLPGGSARAGEVAAVGHRIVHGGKFTSGVLMTPEVRDQISALVELAPLHNPPSLETLAAAETALPGVPQIAIFDTAFHATLPPAAYTYPVPQEWTQDWGIRRYGFHGLSHAYCARRVAELMNRPLSDLKIVICHLGNGCSSTAVQSGKSVETTMGFTPLEGLMMGTRSGSIDPGVVLHVQGQGLTADDVETILNRRSGLLGVSGISGDMRQVEGAAEAGQPAARLAVDIYVHRLRQAIGALAVTMGGLDALVFTAGVGENSSEIRRRTCEGLECLGLQIDNAANVRCRPDQEIALPRSRGRIFVIATREDLTMFEEVRRVLTEKG
ncbi:acetate/propionate family kinase [Planctomicrobium sp. SH664]|uniref:acetate/propionate family kinase n=1 Tax=Planctomicrobium sp. SH664 TaxID=3448125 RepID=UPI003F5AFFCF